MPFRTDTWIVHEPKTCGTHADPLSIEERVQDCISRTLGLDHGWHLILDDGFWHFFRKTSEGVKITAAYYTDSTQDSIMVVMIWDVGLVARLLSGDIVNATINSAVIAILNQFRKEGFHYTDR